MAGDAENDRLTPVDVEGTGPALRSLAVIAEISFPRFLCVQLFASRESFPVFLDLLPTMTSPGLKRKTKPSA